jgi:hypothetical protein
MQDVGKNIFFYKEAKPIFFSMRLKRVDPKGLT